ncbi:hypothetical protein CR513_26456, partial [Mucuna pruriens]
MPTIFKPTQSPPPPPPPNHYIQSCHLGLFTCGVDILGLFPLVVGQLRFLIMVVNYFTKWVEAKSVAMISTKGVKRIVKKIGRGQGEIGRGTPIGTLVIPYHLALHHPENPIQINIWDTCCDPCRDRGAIPKNHFLPTRWQ